MTRIIRTTPDIYFLCIRAQWRRSGRTIAACSSSSTSGPSPRVDGKGSKNPSNDTTKDEQDEVGAMTRRLAAMTEASLEDGGRSAQKSIEDAGFDEDLKQDLLNRIAGASIRPQNPSAFAQVNMPSSAGRGTRDIAAAAPWTGKEVTEDSALRMLNDAFKPLRGPAKMPSPRTVPRKVDSGRPKGGASSGARLANARDRSSAYSYLKDESLSANEREQMRKELKERFSPGARPMPTSLQGLASLANERIEDAIARGQFKNLPRGKRIERDYNMSSPFLDTTEYFMNKIIQRQDIVPPWIEKQQELVSTTTKFRSRLRAEWRRHAARLIASRGGSLESQVQRAMEYAAAEAVVNPSKVKVEQLNSVDEKGQLSQITLAGELKPNVETGTATEGSSVTITLTEAPASGLESTNSPPQNVAEAAPQVTAADIQDKNNPEALLHAESATPSSAPAATPSGALYLFRDADWEQTELSYHKLAIENLNALTRTYNLMAPNMARKPYYSLERELRACFADVAPQLPDELRARAAAPRTLVTVEVGHRPGGVLEKFGGESAKVFDDRRPSYGFKEFWKDLFA